MARVLGWDEQEALAKAGRADPSAPPADIGVRIEWDDIKRLTALLAIICSDYANGRHSDDGKLAVHETGMVLHDVKSRLADQALAYLQSVQHQSAVTA